MSQGSNSFDQELSSKLSGFMMRGVEKCYDSNAENANGFHSCLTKLNEKNEAITSQIGSVMFWASLKADRAMKEGKDREFAQNLMQKSAEAKISEIVRQLD